MAQVQVGARIARLHARPLPYIGIVPKFIHSFGPFIILIVRLHTRIDGSRLQLERRRLVRTLRAAHTLPVEHGDHVLLARRYQRHERILLRIFILDGPLLQHVMP